MVKQEEEEHDVLSAARAGAETPLPMPIPEPISQLATNGEGADHVEFGRCVQRLQQSLFEQNILSQRMITERQQLIDALSRLDAGLQAQQRDLADKRAELSSLELKMRTQLNALPSSHGCQAVEQQPPPPPPETAPAAVAAAAAAAVDTFADIDAELIRLFHRPRAATRTEPIFQLLADRYRLENGSFVTLPNRLKKGKYCGGLLYAPPMRKEEAEWLRAQLRENILKSEVVAVEQEEGGGDDVPHFAVDVGNEWSARRVQQPQQPQQLHRLLVYLNSQAAFDIVHSDHGIHPDAPTTPLSYPPRPPRLDVTRLRDRFILSMTSPRIASTMEAALWAAGAKEVQPLGDAGLRLHAVFDSAAECEVAARVLHGVLIEGAQVGLSLPPSPPQH